MFFFIYTTFKWAYFCGYVLIFWNIRISTPLKYFMYVLLSREAWKIRKHNKMLKICSIKDSRYKSSFQPSSSKTNVLLWIFANFHIYSSYRISYSFIFITIFISFPYNDQFPRSVWGQFVLFLHKLCRNITPGTRLNYIELCLTI